MFLQTNKQKRALIAQVQRVLAGETEDTPLLDAYPPLRTVLEQHARQVASATAHVHQVEAQVETQTLRWQQSEHELHKVRQQLEQTLEREQVLEIRQGELSQQLLQQRQDTQIWELLQSTLTEGCWDITVVNGDLQHPASGMRFSSQFRALLGYGPDDLPDGWDAQVGITHPDDLPKIMAIFDREILGSQGSVNTSLNTGCATRPGITSGAANAVGRYVTRMGNWCGSLVRCVICLLYTSDAADE